MDIQQATAVAAQTGNVGYVEFGNQGEIRSFGSMRLEDYHATLKYTQRKLLLGDGKPETHYVEFVGEARAPVLRVRLQLEQSFDKTEVAPREAATLADLPGATVSFEGPMKGTHRHPGGDLVVGWTLPGTYTVRIEAFPYLPAEFTLTVGDAS